MARKFNITSTVNDAEDRALLHKLEMMKPKMLKALDEEVANRVPLHLAQKPVARNVDREIVGGDNKCGRMFSRRTFEDEKRIESVYALCQTVNGAGVPVAMTVTLRVYADWTCQEAVAWNKGMAAKCYSEIVTGKTLPTRHQTEIQSRVVVMWLRLHGRFFWNKNRKCFNTSLYFDSQKRILRAIKSDDFESWLANHADVNPQKSDFEFLMNEINAIAMNPDVASEADPHALFDHKVIDGKTFVYISNGDSSMVKVGQSATGESISVVPNGTDDVVFLKGQTLAEWELLDGPGEDPFDGCPPFSTANYQSKFGKMLVRLWFLALPVCARSFPAIVFTGKRRSGKSRTAKAVCELLGAPVRLASIEPGTSGKKDFWSVVNKGGVVCFDNVDTRIDWFSDAIQQACTDGSFESRALFTDGDVSTLMSNARIILTSNNPMFFSESGISDRSEIIRLLPFSAESGKETMDDELTQMMADFRSKALTWMARTISKALADDQPVERNVNFRHPDFAKFAMRAARALGLYDDAVLALKSAEFDKSLMTVQNNATVNYVYEALCWHFSEEAKLFPEDRAWSGTASQMQQLILQSHPQLARTDGTANDKLCPSDVSIGRFMSKYIDDLAVIFDLKAPPEGVKIQKVYTFFGFSEAYNRNISDCSTNTEKTIIDENDMPF